MNVPPVYRDVPAQDVIVACMPDHTAEQIRTGTIWTRRFIGVKAGDNPDGTVRVLVYGAAPDLRQSVFWRGRAVGAR